MFIDGAAASAQPSNASFISEFAPRCATETAERRKFGDDSPPAPKSEIRRSVAAARDVFDRADTKRSR